MATPIRLLLVEPSASDRRLIRSLLRGHALRFAVSVASGLDEVHTRLTGAPRYDAALVALDGWSQPFDACEWIRALAPDLPLIVLGQSALVSEAIQRGVAGFVVKTEPDIAHLPNAIAAVVHNPTHSAQPQISQQQEDRSARLLHALTQAAAAMQGALISQDVFQAAAKQFRSVGMILSAFRYVEDENAVVMVCTALAPRVLTHARRLTRLDPMKYHVSIDGSPLLQSVLSSDMPQILPDATQVIREMLPTGLKRLAKPLQRMLHYQEQFGLRLIADGRVYGLILVGYPEGHLIESDRSIIEAFAGQIQAALSRALRFEAMQSRLAARLRELTRLAQISEQMQVRLPLDALLDTIRRAVGEVLGSEQVTIWLRDESTPALHPKAGVDVEAAPQRRLDEAVWRRREYRVGRCYFVPHRAAAFDSQSSDMLIIPLLSGEQLLGAVQVDWLAGGPPPAADDLVSLELFASQSAVALDNALLFERATARLKQRTDELTALTALSAITDQGYVASTLERALDHVLHVTGLEAGIIALLDPPTGALRATARRGLSDVLWNAVQRQPLYLDEGVAGRALMTGRVLVVTHIATDPRVQYYRDEILQDGAQVMIGIGLIGRNPVGAMTLFARSAAPVSDDTLAWLDVAGRQIALSVENTRLLEATRRRQRMSEAIREVNAAVASSLEFEGVLETILDQIGRVVPYDTSSISLVEGDVLRVIALHGLDDPSAVLGHTFSRTSRNPAWQAVFSRQVQVVEDVTRFETWEVVSNLDVRGWIAAPLIVHNEVIGLLTLDNHVPGAYSEEDGRNVALIAQQAAAAIDNARRFQMERGRSERLALLNDLSRELSLALDRDAMLQMVVDRIAGRLGYAYADAFLVDPESRELIWGYHARADVGVYPAGASGERWPPGTGIVGHVVETGETYLCGDASRDPYFVNPAHLNTRSELVIPVRVEERVVCVLSVQSDRLNAFNADDVATLETLAGQLGAALSMMALVDEVQQRASRLSMLFAASHELSSSLDSDQVLGRLAQWLVSAADATSARVYAWDLSTGAGRLVAQYVGGRAAAVERQSKIGVTQWLSRLPELVARMQSRQPLVLSADAPVIDEALRDTLRAFYVTGALYLPLIVRERLIGCAEVWETERAQAWQPDEIHMCQTIANLAAGAIDNARLFEVERERRAVAETVRELAAVVSSSLELQPILQALLDRAAELIPYDSASVLIQGEHGLEVAASRGQMDEYRDGATVPVNPLVDSVLDSQQVQIEADVRNVAGWIAPPGAEHIRGWLGAPLKTKGQLIGALIFASRTPERYRREHAEVAETIADHAAVAIENARLYQETRLHLRELETLQVVSLEVIQSLDVARVAQAIADGALRLLGATAVHLFSFDAEAEALDRIASSAAPGFEEVGQPTPRREGLTMQVARTGQALVINDPYHDPAHAAVIQAWPGRVQAVASLPLHIRRRVLGVMNVIFHIPHAVDDSDVRILGLLADQAATALENARLFETEQQRRVAADVLREMSAVLTSTLRLDEVFEKLFDQIARIIPYTSASVLLIEGSQCLRIVAGRGFQYPDRVIGQTLDLRKATWSGQVIDARKPIIVADVQQAGSWEIFPSLEHIHGWMGAPLVVRSETIGTLAVDHAQAGVYRQEQADLFGAIANQAAAAIANARLYEEALNRERFASALGRVSLAITSTLELNVVLEQICRESADAFGVDNGLVWLVEGDELVGFAGHGSRREAFVGLRVKLDDTSVLGARVLHQRRGEFVNRARASDRLHPEVNARIDVASVLAVPMLKGDMPIGTLVVADSTRADRFEAADIERAEVLATHAAIAIENARLFQAEQRRARQLALVNRVGLDVTSTLDLDYLAQMVVTEICDTFGYYSVSLVMLEDQMLVWRAGVGGDDPNWSAIGLRQPIDVGIIGAAASSGAVVWVSDVRQDPRFVTVPQIQHTRSEVALPLVTKGNVIGVLDVQSDRVNGFSAEDLEVLMPLASQLSVAVENAQLYQTLAKHAASLEARAATILNSVADAVLVTDLTGTIVLTNPMADSVLQQDGARAESGRLRRWLRELTPDSVGAKIDVGDRTLQAAVAYINEQDWPVGHVIVLRDITTLEEVDRLKTKFVTTVSHELRTPLTNIKLYLDLFQKGKPEKRDQYLATLVSEVSRLERLISDLLDLSRLERGPQGPAREEVDLLEVLRHVVTTLEPQAEAKRQSLRLETDRTALRLFADRNQMIQVFVNLAANAINYTPAGGAIALRATTTDRDGQTWVVAAVRDTGIGIAPEDRDRIFDRFYRGRAERTQVGGTGLGLAIVQEIVKQHAGRIDVDSQLGQGSTFTVWLPAP